MLILHPQDLYKSALLLNIRETFDIVNTETVEPVKRARIETFFIVTIVRKQMVSKRTCINILTHISKSYHCHKSYKYILVIIPTPLFIGDIKANDTNRGLLYLRYQREYKKRQKTQLCKYN